MKTNERYSRQADIVPAERLMECKSTVIGVGAIGRQVALQLAAMGIPKLQIVDFDCVEMANLAPQGFLQNDLGMPKVDVTAELIRKMNHDLIVETTFERFKRSTPVGNSVFVCVDSIETRKHIWHAVKDKALFFCDGRMSAEVLRILSVSDSGSYDYYPTTLFTAAEAYAGTCTAKSTIYCANIAAGMMVSQFTKYLRRLPVDKDVQLNLLSMELTAVEIQP